MTETAIGLSAICASSICLISLISSQLYRKEPLITSELMSLVSFLPGFICACIALACVPLHLSASTLVALFVKNILYCASFYFRYESLRIFGPFVGALMLGTQPLLIFVFGLALLGESLTSTQEISIILAASSLLLLTGKNSHAQKRIRLFDFGKYYIFPMIASALALVWDRYFLKGHMSGDDFFIFDRIVLLPTFFLTVVVIKRGRFSSNILFKKSFSVLTQYWKSLALIGVLFTLSAYTYNLALELEKAALVGLFRNSAYPVAAFVGAFIFKQRVSGREWLSLVLICFAVILGAW